MALEGGRLTARAIPVQLGTTLYPNRTAAWAECQRIIRETPLDTWLTGEAAAIAASLLAMHPSREEKAARGVAGFCVRLNHYPDHPPSRSLHVFHPDGGSTEFSYRQATAPRPWHPRDAARFATTRSQRRFKVAYFGDAGERPCQSCGIRVTFGSSHVHHLPPWKFRDIEAAVFAEMAAGGWGEPVLREVEPYGCAFADPEYQDAFITIHDGIAERQVVCLPCNAAAERIET